MKNIIKILAFIIFSFSLSLSQTKDSINISYGKYAVSAIRGSVAASLLGGIVGGMMLKNMDIKNDVKNDVNNDVNNDPYAIIETFYYMHIIG
ncbi:MAG: hypothetical protein KAR38_13960, partial [Calditrichia bacterium]|nr:hypothetical protein [Calditrichia bacterium]